ncbi:hypothetical protein MUK42_33653 [Musa troglodytarum]|uniref:Uncharacterized protein n=1 Tax=Musa troglodytarum TaxID=320322 RepID=A0A9E7GAM0_9LILI|nr:hypothetical protein MUK42_33653 [Musa troglodytarum]
MFSRVMSIASLQAKDVEEQPWVMRMESRRSHDDAIDSLDTRASILIVNKSKILTGLWGADATRHAGDEEALSAERA